MECVPSDRSQTDNVTGLLTLPFPAQWLFKFVVVPVLAALALGEYAVLLGPPPELRVLVALPDKVKVC